MGTGVRHIDKYKTEILLIASTGSTITQWIDMELYSHVTFFVAANNSSTGTPAITVTAYQAPNIASSSASVVLSINNYFYCTGGFSNSTSSSTADAWTQVSTGITGGSFATSSTRGSTGTTLLGYAVEIQDTDLNLNSSWTCVALSFGAAASTTVTVWAHCFPRFDGNFANFPSALT
jgi:hypothetical protein